MKRYLVLGSNGSIGGAIAQRLLAEGNAVIGVGMSPESRLAVGVEGFSYLSIDVTSWDLDVPFLGLVDGIVYAVGCGDDISFDESSNRPLVACEQPNIFMPDYLVDQIEVHTLGLLLMLRQQILGANAMFYRGAPVVVIGSATERIGDGPVPSWLQIGAYATAKAAQHELVRWLRRDPLVVEYGFKIHWLGPSAVESNFHEGSVLKPRAILPLDAVVDAVMEAIASPTVVDRMLLPEPLK